jgi:hypothetical protein
LLAHFNWMAALWRWGAAALVAVAAPAAAAAAAAAPFNPANATWVLWPSQPPPGCPLPPSADLVGFEYALGGAAVPPGIAADTWYPAWTDVLDDAGCDVSVSSWTDGVVYNVTSQSFNTATANATTGVARVHCGDCGACSPWNLTLSHVDVVHAPPAPYEGRYPSLSAFVGGTWYYGTYALENWRHNGDNPAPDCSNWCVLGPLTGIRSSKDLGATWDRSGEHVNMSSWTDNLWGEAAVNNSKVVMGAPHAVDWGRAGAAAPDGRLYVVATGALGPASYQSWMQGDTVNLARTTGPPDPATINDPASWEFYAGGHGSGAVWAPTVSGAAPLFTWPQRTGVVTASYAPSLGGKVLMVVSTPHTSPSTEGAFDTYLLEADDITGPSSLVAYLSTFGPQVYFAHWPSRWMDAVPVGGGPRATRRARTAPVPVAPQQQPPEGDAAAAADDDQVDPTEPLAAGADADAADAAAAAPAAQHYWTSYMSYSANFAGTWRPNPAGAGYHWTLQASRLQLGAQFAARLRARREQQQQQQQQPQQN